MLWMQVRKTTRRKETDFEHWQKSSWYIMVTWAKEISSEYKGGQMEKKYPGKMIKHMLINKTEKVESLGINNNDKAI